jgi:hypothetical protein
MKVAKMKPKAKPGSIRKAGPAPSKKPSIRSLPLPAYELILQYLAYNFKSVQDFALVCKKFSEVARTAQQHWFQLSLLHFAAVLGKSQDVEALQTLRRENKTQPGVDWMRFFMTQKQAQNERKRKLLMTKWGKIFNTNSGDVAYYRKQWEALGCGFAVVQGKSISPIPAQNVTFFHTGICIALELLDQPKRLPTLQAEIQGLKLDFPPPKASVVSPGDVSLHEGAGVLTCVYTSGETCYAAWNVNYFLLAQRFAKFKYPTREDDLDHMFGLRGYDLIIEIRDATCSIQVLTLRNFDLKVSGSAAVATIDCVNEATPLPLDVGFAWRITAFDGKFAGVCVVEALLRSEFGDIVWTASRGTKIRPLANKVRLEGETCALTCEDEKGGLTLSLLKSATGYDIKKAAVTVKLTEIEKMYRRAA